MQLEPDLDKWDYGRVVDLVRHHDYEPERFDFKEVLVPLKAQPDKSREAHNQSIRKAACAMGNSLGGFLIFGVIDRENAPKDATPENRVVGIPDADSLRQFGNLLSVVTPNLEFAYTRSAIPIPGRKGQGVFVVRIDRSPRRPHEIGGVFYKRGRGGSCEPMDANEVREQMLNTESLLRKLDLLRTELLFLKRTLSDLRDEGDQNLHVLRFDVSGVKPLLAETCTMFDRSAKVEEDFAALNACANHANALMNRLNEYASELRSQTKLGSSTRDNLSDVLSRLGKTVLLCESHVDGVLARVHGKAPARPPAQAK